MQSVLSSKSSLDKIVITSMGLIQMDMTKMDLIGNTLIEIKFMKKLEQNMIQMDLI